MEHEIISKLYKKLYLGKNATWKSPGYWAKAYLTGILGLSINQRKISRFFRFLNDTYGELYFNTKIQD